MPKKIRHSVGMGGSNAYGDVATIQYLLNCVPKSAGGPVNELAVDGIAGPLTQAAIKRFQTAWTGHGNGRVDAGAATLQKLQTYDPYPHQPMPLPVSGGRGGKWVPAGKFAANQAIVHGITEAIAAAVAAASGLPAPGMPGWKTPQGVAGGAAGAVGKVTSVVQAAAQAAAKAIEEAARMGGKGKIAPSGGEGMLGPIQKAAEAAKRAAEAAAKQAGLKVPQGGYDIPAKPGGPGGPFGLGEVVRKVGEAAQRAAKDAGAGGKTIDPAKLPMPMPPLTPGSESSVFGKIIQSATEAAAKAVKQMSHDDGGIKTAGGKDSGGKGGASGAAGNEPFGGIIGG